MTLGIQRNIKKAESQGNFVSVISGYRLLFDMIIKPKEENI